MSCEYAQLVQACHDRQLSSEQAAEVGAHLRECGECRELVAELEHLSRLIATAPLAEIPPAAMQRLEQSYWARRGDRGVLRLAECMTGLAAAVLIGVMMFSRTTQPEPPVRTASLETAALMPPPESRDDASSPSDVVVLAEWMANDLSPAQSGGNR